MTINRDFFFDFTRTSLFAGSLRQSQVTGLSLLLDTWDRDHAALDDRWLAYILATVHHETDRTFRPIEEYGRGRGRPYAPRYYGRGYCQLTWDYNYRKFGDLLGVELYDRPELALEPVHAAPILFTGMIRGLYTGKKLANYIDGPRCDWVQARRIVNGLDKANAIADYARRYYAAISHTT